MRRKNAHRDVARLLEAAIDRVEQIETLQHKIAKLKTEHRQIMRAIKEIEREALIRELENLSDLDLEMSESFSDVVTALEKVSEEIARLESEHD